MNLGCHRQNIPLVLTLSCMALIGLFFILNRGRGLKENSKPPVPHAGSLDTSTDQKLQKFTLTGFDAKGKKFWKLEGDAAMIDQAQTVFLKDNVTLRLKDDTVIHADKVQWAQTAGTFKTDAPVKVDHEKTKIRGTGAYGEPNKSFVQLNRNITMIVDPGTTITCTGPMKIYYSENKTTFYRNVKVVDSRGVLTAKRMDVYFDNAQKKVTQIVAIGDVVIDRGSDTTHSDRAIYTLATGSIRLEGSPQITLQKASSSILDGAARN